MSKSIVVTDDSGKKYRLVMEEGGLENITVGKIKRYMSKSTGAEPSRIRLYFGKTELIAGEERGGATRAGFTDGCILRMKIEDPSRQGHAQVHFGTPAEASTAGKDVGIKQRADLSSVTGVPHQKSFADDSSASERSKLVVTARPQGSESTSGVDSQYELSSPPPAPAPISSVKQPFPPHLPHTSVATFQQNYSTGGGSLSVHEAEGIPPPPPPPLSLRDDQSSAHKRASMVYREPSISISPQRPQSQTQQLHRARVETNPHDHSFSTATSNFWSAAATHGSTTSAAKESMVRHTTSAAATTSGRGGMLSPRRNHGSAAPTALLHNFSTSSNSYSYSASTSNANTDRRGREENGFALDPRSDEEGVASSIKALSSSFLRIPKSNEEKFEKDVAAERTRWDEQLQADQVADKKLPIVTVTSQRETFLIAERDELADRLKSLEEKVERERSELDLEYKKLREERRKLKEDREFLELERDKSRQRVRELDEREEEFRRKQEVFDQQKEEIKAEEKAREHASGEGNSKKRRERSSSPVVAQLEEEKAKNKELLAQIERLKREHEENLEKLLSEHDDELERIRKHQERSEGEYAKLQGRLKDYMDKAAEARDSLLSERKANARVADQLKKEMQENESLRKDLAEIESNIRTLREELSVAKRRRGAAEDKAETCEERLRDAKDRYKAAEARAERAESDVSRANEKVASLSSQLNAVKDELETIQETQKGLSRHQSKNNNKNIDSGGEGSGTQAQKRGLSGQLGREGLLEASLAEFATVMRVPPLRLDDNHTCVVTADNGSFSLLVTYDQTTEKLFLYATLLSQLPRQDVVKIRLYEELLEGALLGREMGGGGVGISKKNGLVIMSASVDLRHTDEFGLANLARPFAAAVRRWIVAAEEIAGIPPSQSLIRDPSVYAAAHVAQHDMSMNNDAPKGYSNINRYHNSNHSYNGTYQVGGGSSGARGGGHHDGSFSFAVQHSPVVARDERGLSESPAAIPAVLSVEPQPYRHHSGDKGGFYRNHQHPSQHHRDALMLSSRVREADALHHESPPPRSHDGGVSGAFF